MILDDCYNANPISTRAAIDVLDMAIGRKVAILGNMGELGDKELDLHREVGAYCAEKGIDVVCALYRISISLAEGASANPQTETHWFETKADFLSAMNEIIRDGDNVLVKASHGMWFPELVEELQKF